LPHNHFLASICCLMSCEKSKRIIGFSSVNGRPRCEMQRSSRRAAEIPSWPENGGMVLG
jgi:hypothetical protein